jgi:acetyl esterase/lipase
MDPIEYFLSPEEKRDHLILQVSRRKTLVMTTLVFSPQLRGLLYGPSTEARYVALFLHGGCFQDGDETWNSEQCKGLAEATQGILVTLNFSQANRAVLMEDCRAALAELRKQYPTLPLGIYGGSSGGYYALELAWEEIGLGFCVALCPEALWLYL